MTVMSIQFFFYKEKKLKLAVASKEQGVGFLLTLNIF